MRSGLSSALCGSDKSICRNYRAHYPRFERSFPLGDLMRSLIGLVFASGLVVACATSYSQPNKNEPYAEIELVKSYGDHDYAQQFFSQGRQQYFHVLAGENCSEPELLSIFVTGAPGNSSTKRVPANKEIVISSLVNIRDVGGGAYAPGASGGIGVSACLSAIRFTPEAGKKYRMHMIVPSIQECELKLEVPAESVQQAEFSDKGTCTKSEYESVYEILYKMQGMRHLISSKTLYLPEAN